MPKQTGFDFARDDAAYDTTSPYQQHSDTSRLAAAAIEPKSGTLRRAVLDFLRCRGDVGATDEEMQTALAMNANTQRPRRVELLRAGLIRESGQLRRTGAGRDAVVWRVSGG